MDEARTALKVKNRLLGSLRNSHEYGLTASELNTEYQDGEHPTYSLDQWMESVLQRSTRSGYWDWVVNWLEMEENDESLV